jgi:hypothetical protein
MPGRVLSTEQAKSSIQQAPAQQFRDQTWPETKAALDKAKQELDQLREQLQKIAQNIMTAGGGS